MSSTGSTVTWRRSVAVLAVVVAASSACSSGEPGAPRTDPAATQRPAAKAEVEEFDVPSGSRPHDVAPARDGGVWYTAQGAGALGYLGPKDGKTRHIDLGDGSAPHGVIVGPDGAPWITDSGLNAIVRVDPKSERVTTYPLPDTHPNANLNTATFDGDGVLWFTGQAGVYGRLDPRSSDPKVEAFDAPKGAGPYGIATTPDGDVYYASLAGNHIAVIDRKTNQARRIDPPTPGQGARRVWADSRGDVWVSEWNVGKLGRYEPDEQRWGEWELPGNDPMAYAVYVDEDDIVWVSDFGANALQRFDPQTERFTTIDLPSPGASIRQILGRQGEVWGAESGVDKIVVVRTR